MTDPMNEAVPQTSDTSADHRWYLMFKGEMGDLAGLRGPFLSKEIAEHAMQAMLRAEEYCAKGLAVAGVEPLAQCIWSPWQTVEVIDLSPAEIEMLAP